MNNVDDTTYKQIRESVLQEVEEKLINTFSKRTGTLKVDTVITIIKDWISILK